MTPALSLTGTGVRHARDRREAAGDRRRGAGRDRFLVLLSRLAQVHVHVDQTRDRRRARSACRRRRRRVDGQIAADPRDAVAVDQHVEHAVAAVRRIDDAPAFQQSTCSCAHRKPSDFLSCQCRTILYFSASDFHASPPRRRPRADTAPPSGPRRRWRPARESPNTGPSATSEAISTPRFIGPGCMMMTSGLAARRAPSSSRRC